MNVLDAGCGDGSLTRRCLVDTTVNRYVGIDLSADALSRVRSDPPRGNGDQSAEVILHCEDLLRAMPAMEERSFDVVLANYSLHHSSREGKRELLSQIARILKTPDGVFIWSDIARRPDQARSEFLESLEEEIRLRWSALRRRGRAYDRAHPRLRFPGRGGWMLHSARRCGLKLVSRLHRDSYSGCWCFAFAADQAGVSRFFTSSGDLHHEA